MRNKLKLLLLVWPLALVGGAALASHINGPFFIGTTPTKLPRGPSDVEFELQNSGPNPVWCVDGVNVDGGAPYFTDGGGAACVVGQGRQVPGNGGIWVSQLQAGWAPIWCIAQTAAQVGDGGSTYAGW